MSFLFKSSKKQQASALPAATRNVKSSDGTTPPSASGHARHGSAGSPREKTEQTPTPGTSVNSLNSLGDKLQDSASWSSDKPANNTPSPEQKAPREPADSDLQVRRCINPSPSTHLLADLCLISNHACVRNKTLHRTLGLNDT
jgi:hypothetical protein